MGKMRIAVIFGGKSGEHEVSLVSASSVIKALNPDKYDVLQIGISKDGIWYSGADCLKKFKEGNLQGLEEISLLTNPKKLDFDLAFPVLHGPFGEDGTIQGLFEMLGVPYVGCGVLASSTAMDKLQCKAIWESAGLPVVPYIGFGRKTWEEKSEKILEDVKKEIGFPCFVKPANMGSSVGISKVKKEEELRDAIDLAAKFDRRILVEVSVNAREIECAVLGNDDPIASPVGEVIVGGEFYDFHDKYVNGVSTTEVPADLTEELSTKIRDICIKAYTILDCSGLSRVDCFLDRDSGKIYLNEINTLPGFTSISMYPKMMEAHGLSYGDLVDTLIELALERFENKQKNQVVFDSGSDWFTQ
ncbi:MAG: D-alanine--D-alanine ligase [bacterium]|nr:D-alanine--D-alanine ligase [bacterium]